MPCWVGPWNRGYLRSWSIGAAYECWWSGTKLLVGWAVGPSILSNYLRGGVLVCSGVYIRKKTVEQCGKDRLTIELSTQSTLYDKEKSFRDLRAELTCYCANFILQASKLAWAQEPLPQNVLYLSSYSGLHKCLVVCPTGMADSSECWQSSQGDVNSTHTCVPVCTNNGSIVDRPSLGQ